MCIWIACAEKKTQPDLGLPAQCSVHWNSGFCWRSVGFLFTAAIKGKEEESLFNKNPFHKTPWKASVINRTRSKTFMSEADRGRRIRSTKPSRSGTPMFSDSQGFDANWLPAEFYTRKPWSQSCICLRDGTVNAAPWAVSISKENFQTTSHWPQFLHPWVRRSRERSWREPWTQVQPQAGAAVTENSPSPLSASQVPSTTSDGSLGSNYNYCHDSSCSPTHLWAEQMVQGFCR